MNTPRIAKIDVLKGIAILLMVLGHSIQYKVQDFDSNIIFRFIYSMHMPLFMFLSGYVAWGKNIDLKRKAQMLVIPFVAWFLIDYLYQLIFSHTDFNFWDCLVGLIKRPDYGLWFLWVLFLNFVVLALVKKLADWVGDKGEIATYIAVYLILQLSPVVYFGIALLQWHAFFFGAGYLFAGNKDRLLFKKTTGYAFLVLFPVCAYFWNRTIPPNFAYSLKNLLVRFPVFYADLICIYNYLTPILGIGFVWKLVPDAGGLLYKLIQKLGTRTLEIYIIHAYFLITPWVALDFVFACSMSLITAYLLKKIKFLRIVLFGQVSG